MSNPRHGLFFELASSLKEMASLLCHIGKEISFNVFHHIMRRYMRFNRGAAYPMNIIVIILASLLIGLLTSHLAQKRGRDSLTWFIVGILMGVFSLLLLYLLPSVSKQERISSLAKGSSPVPSSMSVEAASFNSRGSKPNDANDLALATAIAYPISKELAEQKEKDWYYADSARQQQGPIPYEDLRLALKRGDVIASSLVWSDGMADWTRLDAISEVYADLAATSENDSISPF
ncbi:MAG: DUF4339 domain-containing protein [Nitrosomonas sp.]|nr:MAG: DUF4339 domain-containing protein [Nitrosomonas sp.]